MDECWADDVVELERALDRAHVATHATDTENECKRHGRLPTDSLANLRKAGCSCWGGYQLNKQQGEELRAEMLAALSAVVDTLRRDQAAILAELKAQRELSGRKNGSRA